MTFDILRRPRKQRNSLPFFTLDDVENTQVLILDDSIDGPYFDLWTLFAKKPILGLGDLPESISCQNIMLPLPGGSNPIWQGDWESHSCKNLDLLRAFVERVLDYYQVETSYERSGPLLVTFMNRAETRRLIDVDGYLDEAKAKLAHVEIQSVDFATLPFKQQLQIIRETDILVGVHGAGLTHGMFLRPGSVMVEILPAELNYKGFRNLAGLLGHTYFSAHASANAGNREKRDEWHNKNVFVEKDRFLDLLGVAVRSMYNKGLRSYDYDGR